MGFFYIEDKTKHKSSKAEMPIDIMHERRCKVCPRNHDKLLISPKMIPTGAFRRHAVIYFLGEAPGAEEDKKARQFVGQSGRYLRDQIPKKWVNLIRWNNTIRCRPPDNRDPLPQEVECCRKLQEEDIAKHKPKLVILVGLVPTRWCFDTHNNGIHKWRGRIIPVKIGGHVCWAYPILHPAGVLRQSGGRKYKADVERVFERDLKRIFRAMSVGLPDPVVIDSNHSDGIEWIKKGTEQDLQRVKKMLDRMAKEKVCSMDIETKNLRPYKRDSKILSCSITTRKHGTFAFPLGRKPFWKTESLKKKAFLLLKNFIEESGKKVCHNATFEQEWFAYEFGMDTIANTEWADTMALGYSLDSRKGMLNLGVLTFIYFGFNVKGLSDVDTKTDLETVLTIDELCKYNGLDSKWTLALYYQMLRVVKREGLLHVAKERVRTGITLVGAQTQGVPVNKKVAAKHTKKIERKLRILINNAGKTRAWKKFVSMKGRDPNPDSPPDMAFLFDRIMKVKECKTGSGSVTTQEDVISKISYKRYPVTPLVLEIRSLNTVKGTFLDSLEELVYPDGRLHTSYNHLFTTSSRLSSVDPNLQNWPVHKWKVIRELIQESGLNITSFDYGQIEARVLAMASLDDVFIKMLWDRYDVHAEWSERIHDEFKGCLKAIGIDGRFSDTEVAKEYRQEVKNKWVFPLFFGASMRSVAGYLNLPENVTEYLYYEFWSVFEGIRDWQESLMGFYNSKGYVETLTGKRRYAPCSYNEIINHPIQGTASDIVLDASNRLFDKGIQFNLNIHDDLTFLMEDSKSKVRKISKIMCKPSFDFINVPLVVEVKSGPDWYNQKEAGVFSSNETFNYH